ncbi:hypothetical protein evm_014627 [Chilo suppressalis]|nr:hypothetical protein evm_014627 [Chilo suppressalis]
MEDQASIKQNKRIEINTRHHSCDSTQMNNLMLALHLAIHVSLTFSFCIEKDKDALLSNLSLALETHARIDITETLIFLKSFKKSNKIASTMTVTRVAESRTEFKLKSLPEDAISSVKFAPKSSQFLLVSSWDCSVRLYDVLSNSERINITMNYLYWTYALGMRFIPTVGPGPNVENV